MGYGLVFVILQRCPLGDSHSFAAEVADDLRGVLLLSLAFMEWEPLTELNWLKAIPALTASGSMLSDGRQQFKQE